MHLLRPHIGFADSGRSRRKLANKQWPEFELILYIRHSLATWCQWHNEKKLWSRKSVAPNIPGAREADIQQLTPTPDNNTQRLGEQMHNSNEVTLRCPQIFTLSRKNFTRMFTTGLTQLYQRSQLCRKKFAILSHWSLWAISYMPCHHATQATN